MEYSPDSRLRIGFLGINGDDIFANAHRSLYPNFMKWCKENGKKSRISTNVFSTQLREALSITLGINGVEWKRSLRVPDDNKTSAGFIGLKLVDGTSNSIINHAFSNCE